MTYRYDLETDADPPFTDALGTQIVEFAVGYDLDEDKAVLMSVMLVPIGEAHDLRFRYREQDLSKDWKVSAPDYSREAVKKYVPKKNRFEVLTQLLRAVLALLGAVSPENITMETFTLNLPEEAGPKYHAIRSVLEADGYRTEQHFRDETTGKDYWLFKRRAGEYAD